MIVYVNFLLKLVMKSSTQTVYLEKELERISSEGHIVRTSAKTKSKIPRISELSGLSWIILEREEYS